MIVDDEYVIVGSANINQRSMAGSRDTEIAMGAYQPSYTWGKMKRHPRGQVLRQLCLKIQWIKDHPKYFKCNFNFLISSSQVYGYRMSLWAEHLGNIDDCFKEPESLPCVKAVNKIAEDNWKKYTATEYAPLQGHLLKYPIEVSQSGKIGPLTGHETFPDFGGKVLGARSNLPDALTT